jgi:hypothetical protein
MRVFAAVLLGMSLVASPLLARNAGEAGKEDAPAAAVNASAVPDKPTPVKAEGSAIESEMQDLRSLVEEQRAELESQRAALKAQQLKMEALEEKLGGKPSESVATPAAEPAPTPAITSTAISSATSSSSAGAPIGTPSKTAMAAMSRQGNGEQQSPLFFKIGTAEFYPLGFLDATSIFRSTNLTTQGGGSIGTSFGSIPFNNTVLGQDTEEKFSTQNSRIGLRVESAAGGGHVTGYLEADFLGYLAPNGNVTSNSDSLRMRLYWVDYKRGMWEVLGGQSWSLLTPNRNGLSALPGDLFYGQEMDTNYLLGLTWARQTGIRVLLHPTKSWAIGVSAENPQQLLPSTVTLPSTVPSQFNTGTTGAGGTVLSSPNIYGNQFDTNSGNTSSTNGVNNTSIPNLVPDLIVKTAFDADPGGHHFHFDVAGLLRTFRAVNLVQSTFASPTSTTIVSPTYSTIHGGGIAGTLNIELVKNLRFIATSFYSYGGGRYIASTAGPDLIVRPDGNLSAIRSGSGIGGFEYQITPKFLVYGYYSGAYFGRNVGQVVTTVAATGGTGTCTVTTNSGYGFYKGSSVVATPGTGTCSAPGGSNNSSDRYLFEPTFGFVQTFWRNPSYGDLKVITQYSYVSRTPWLVSAGSPATAHTSMVYVDLRYDLP